MRKYPSKLRRTGRPLFGVAGSAILLLFPAVASATMHVPPSRTVLGAADVFPVPSSIPDDCSVDVTVALNNWIATVPNGTTSAPSVLTFPAESCYEIEGTIVLSNRTNLILDGDSTVQLGASASMPATSQQFNGAEFLAKTSGSTFNPSNLPAWGQEDTPNGAPVPNTLWPRARAQFLLYRSSNITLENLRIHGWADQDPRGEGVNFVSDYDGKHNCNTYEDLTCNYAYHGQYGVIFRGSSGQVLNNFITDTEGDFVDVASSDSTNTTATVIPSSQVTMAGNYMVGANGYGPTVFDGELVTVTNNYIANTVSYGVVFDLEPLRPTSGCSPTWYANYVAYFTGASTTPPTYVSGCDPGWFNDYVSLTSNTIGIHDRYFVAAHGSSAIDSNLAVEDNVISSGSAAMTFGWGLSTRRIANITETSPNSPPIIRGGLTIIGNQGTASTHGTPGSKGEEGGITVSGFTGVDISNNTYTIDTSGAAGPAIMFNLVTHATVKSNSFTQAGSNPLSLLQVVHHFGAADSTYCGNLVNGVLVDKACA